MLKIKQGNIFSVCQHFVKADYVSCGSFDELQDVLWLWSLRKCAQWEMICAWNDSNPPGKEQQTVLYLESMRKTILHE